MPPKLPADIAEYIARNFPKNASFQATRILQNAVLHNGKRPGSRVLRCALASCDNTVESLERQVSGIAIDFRDVIVAGEYISESGELIRARDLSQPFIFDD